MGQRILVHHTASGGDAVTELECGLRRVIWDQPVKALPEVVADRLLASPGFHQAVPIEIAVERWGLSEARLLKAAESHQLTAAVHRPAEGDAFPVVVLDGRTREYLTAHAADPSNGATKGATP